MSFFSIPQIQQVVAAEVVETLRDAFDSDIDIEHVEIGLFNRILLSGIHLKDQSGSPLFDCKKVSAKFQLLPLLIKSDVYISNIELDSPFIYLRKKTKNGPYNFQYLADKLKSNDTTANQTKLQINAIIIRNAQFCHTLDYDSTSKTPLKLSRLRISGCNANISLKHLSADSINFRIRTLRLAEQSGLRINDMQFNVISNKKEIRFGRILLKMPGSKLELEPSLFRIQGGRWRTACGTMRLKSSQVALSDFSFLKSSLAYNDHRFQIDGTALLSPQQLKINHLQLRDDTKSWLNDFSVVADRHSLNENLLTGSLVIHKFHSTPSALCRLLCSFVVIGPKNESLIGQIGNIDIDGQISMRNNRIESAKGLLHTDAIHTNLSLNTTQGQGWSLSLGATKIMADRFQISDAGEIGLTAKIEKRPFQPDSYLYQVIFDKLVYKQYPYREIVLNGTYRNNDVSYQLQINDPNLNMATSGDVRLKDKHFNGMSMKMDITHLYPNNLLLTRQYPQTKFEGEFDLDLNGNSAKDMNGYLDISKLTVHSPDTTYQTSLHADFSTNKTYNELRMKSDFMVLGVKGNFQMADIPQCVQNIVANYLPDLCAQDTKVSQRDNELSFDVIVHKSDFFKHVLRLPIQMRAPVVFSGYLNSNSHQTFIDGNAPDLSWDGNNYRDLKVHMKERSGTLHTLVQVTKEMKKSNVKFALEAQASDNRIQSHFQWKDLMSDKYKGEIKLDSKISSDNSDHPLIATTVLPTQIYINDSIWNLNRSVSYYQGGTFKIRNFKLSHKKQFLVLNGSMASGTRDSISANLNAINLEYLFNILNFHAVDFTGFASGSVSVTKNEDNNPALMADLFVKDFTFNSGRMGDMNLIGVWDHEKKRINLNADIKDRPSKQTKVNGYVSLKDDELDLLIQSRQTNLYFLNSFLSGILKDIQGQTTGWCRLFGPTKKLDLEGKQVVDLDLTLPITNTRYAVRQGTILLEPGKIELKKLWIADNQENKGELEGVLTHQGLGNFRYNLQARPEKLLLYNHSQNSDLPFYGTIYGSGNITLDGYPGTLNINITLHPEKKSHFYYNADQPDGGEVLQLLQIKPKNENEHTSNPITATKNTGEQTAEPTTDIRLNFAIDVNQDLDFHIILDEKSGDNIRSTGYGLIRAAYYNKGNFQLFGTYNIVDGVYKMSMQDIIRKDFQLTPGGRIIFSGNPNDGDLAFSAVHTINSASLSDLNIGNNFSSTPTKVNCILNFGGKVRLPRISFDLDLPNINTDEKQMIRNLISTEEDMNMQIIYLLSIGRFYTYDYNQTTYNTQSQSSVAVQSLLSTTLSSQLNSMLSNVLDNKNWTIGTNFYTGNMGWSDMEVAGILSGRMLNNRLLINGNFGYRERPEYSSNFIGDFNIQWLLNKNGNIRLKAYSEINDRYFTKSTLSTQGGGILLRHDFNKLGDLLKWKVRSNNAK